MTTDGSDKKSKALENSADFKRLLLAGLGSTRSPNPQGEKFKERIKSGEFSQSGLQSVATGLDESIWQVINLTFVPFLFFVYGRRYQTAHLHFCNELGYRERPIFELVQNDSGAWMPPTDEERQLKEKHKEKMLAWLLGEIDDPGMNVILENSDRDVGGFPLRERESDNGTTNALARALVVEGWTLFESLSEDLWEAALNFHPTVLGQLNGKAKVSFDDLQRSDFNVKKRMGTLLKQKEPIGFRAIKEIQESYRLAFSAQFKLIEQVLFDPGLQYAAAVRNLLIHKRGYIDQEFLDQTAGLSGFPQFKAEHLQTKFPLTGELCTQLVDSCLVCATWLVNGVHAWIIGHPERPPSPGSCGELDSGSLPRTH